jgi:hypothetical protein
VRGLGFLLKEKIKWRVAPPHSPSTQGDRCADRGKMASAVAKLIAADFFQLRPRKIVVLFK